MGEVETSRVLYAKRSRTHKEEQDLSEQPVARRGNEKRRREADAYMNLLEGKWTFRDFHKIQNV